VAGLLDASLIGASCTTGAAVVPGATVKVSSLNRPTNVPLASPRRSRAMSPWYQDSPNGAFGAWITNRSYSVFGARPLADTTISSTLPSLVIFTCGLRVGQAAAALGGCGSRHHERRVGGTLPTTRPSADWPRTPGDAERDGAGGGRGGQEGG
jgi:hypothetical protein